MSAAVVCLPAGYELDDDRGRVDIDVVHAFLSRDSYWAPGRPRELVARSWAGSARVLGCYRGDAMVGGARVISDVATFAYLADVFVLPEHRGRGLGVAVVREAVEHPDYRSLRWNLHTRDAQSLYGRFGFVAAPPTGMDRGREEPWATRAAGDPR